MEKIAIYDMSYPRAITHIYFINILLNEIYTRHYSYKTFEQQKRRGKLVILLFLIKKKRTTNIQFFFNVVSNAVAKWSE